LPPSDFEAPKAARQKKVTATFADTLPLSHESADPSASAVYAIEVLNSSGRSAGLSNEARISLVPTLPPFADFSAKPEAAGIRISWRCAHQARNAPGVQYVFRIFRRLDSASNEVKIAEVPATACAEDSLSSHAADSYLDQSFEWERSYFYRGTVVSVVESPGEPPVEVEGYDTPISRVWAHDLFPPATPEAPQAIFFGPGQSAFIDLIWAPVSDADLAGYNVYRREGNQALQKLNAEPLPAPAFRDSNVSSHQTYFYAVSAIDRRGNESPRSPESPERVP
jgi:hypothetical protein